MVKRYSEDVLDSIEEQFRLLVEGPRWRYLVADPSVALRRGLVQALRKAGAEEVAEAATGKDAFHAALGSETPCAVLIDLEMPEVDAAQFLRALRKSEEHGRDPVIVMSAEVSRERIVQAVRAGANAYLRKPFEPAVLLAKLKELGAL